MKLLINLALFFFLPLLLFSQKKLTPADFLQQLMHVLPEDRRVSPGDQLPGTPPPHVSPDDFTWSDWVSRSGELPPDFDLLPSLPFLPNPLIIDEGRENIPVTTMALWQEKRQIMKEQMQHWITGTIPPPPGQIMAKVIEERNLGELTERDVLLRFGPDMKAQLHITLLIPPGEGPFPVFICPWKKDRYDWVQAAVRRGYIACRFAATDPKYGYHDDSEEYEELYWPEFDFSTIMRWGWAASRAIDYLHTLEQVNREQIALTGLSRNGKMALWAAALDERIKAVIPISGGTGGEMPFRYTSDRYATETIEYLTWIRPHWLHPRLRFFIGRENKMPVDQNSLMALIAPRGLMLTSSYIESAGNAWAMEQAYHSALEAYEFLGAENRLAIDNRLGLHSPAARDIERYLDFFDYVFSRNYIKPTNHLLYNYSFSKWSALSNETIDPTELPPKQNHDLLADDQSRRITTVEDWDKKANIIRQHIKWGLGKEPHSVGPGQQPDYMPDVVGLPRVGPDVESRPLLFGQLYYKKEHDTSTDKKPAIIYLHPYSYSTGYAKSGHFINQLTKSGFVVFAFDQIGFGSRIEEGTYFYERFPKWSKMGRMVADVRWAVDALHEIDFIDADQIWVAGYALGGSVGLYSAALDNRIAGVASVSGFSPMRTNTPGKTAEGIYEYSHLHGLIPRLGFFAGKEEHIPYDFDEIMGCIAPRPLLIISPTWDQYTHFDDVQQCVFGVKKVYALHSSENNIQLIAPVDYNRFSPEFQEEVIRWIKKQ